MVYGELPDLLCAGSPIEEKCEIKVGTWESNPGPLHFPPARLPTEPIISFVYIIIKKTNPNFGELLIL